MKREPELRGPRGEPAAELGTRAKKIARTLIKAYPDASIPLKYGNPLELLIATILSAQCTDKKVNEVTAVLFRKYTTAEDWAKAPIEQLEQELHPTGFFRSKSRSIKESTADILERFGGRVPDTIEELTSLRGIGRKTANVVLAHVFGKPAVIVDTHFQRLARRMGITGELDPTKIESEIMEILPERYWSDFSLAMTLHGRAVCDAKKPFCEKCAVGRYCPAFTSHGEITWRVKLPPPRGKRSTAAKKKMTAGRLVKKNDKGSVKKRGSKARRTKRRPVGRTRRRSATVADVAGRKSVKRTRPRSAEDPAE
jgi:endonuclease-3